MLIAIDPGTYESGVVWLEDDGRVIQAEQLPNEEIVRRLEADGCDPETNDRVVIEMITQPGRAGRETYETCRWIGRFEQAAGPTRVTIIRRDDIRFHWAGDASGNDATLRQAVIDHYGGKEIAIGSRKSPGPLAGITKHCWQALALAIAYQRGCRSKVFTRADKAS